jgi:S1-C subfamily serine protease
LVDINTSLKYQGAEAAGTGIVVTSNGEILTNNHVIAGATAVTVTVFGQTNALPAHVVGTDPSTDLALVQIDDASGLPTVTFGDSARSQVGDGVLAIGNALALAGGPPVTEGIVSALNRTHGTLGVYRGTARISVGVTLGARPSAG